MTHLLLAFDGRINRTLCAFTSSVSLAAFLRAFPSYDGLPTVNPLHEPIPCFDSAAEAVAYFRRGGTVEPSMIRRGMAAPRTQRRLGDPKSRHPLSEEQH